MKPNRSVFRIPAGRRSLAAVLAVTALAAAACGADPETTTPATPMSPPPLVDLSNTLMVLEARHNVMFGIAAYSPTGARTFEWNAGDRFALAATFKVYAVAALLRMAERGEVDLAERVPIRPEELVLASPVTHYHRGETLTWYDLAQAALVRSDNTAANLILRRIGGPPAVTALARMVGDTETRLDRWEPALNEALPGDTRDTTTPAAFAGGLNRLILGNALIPEHRRMLTGWMRASVTSGDRMRQGLPIGWAAADKSGAGAYGTVNDAGVVWSPTGTSIVLSIFSRSTTGYPMAAPSNQAIADATKAILRAVTS
ncbi:class A beta-lactamase [Nocardia carnea]|uniref:class A beta-lactamase n=1 Tax=Nocardia carnea TaxID=37328 RepID=UPI002455F0B4|nr:class A beta-lactamase [Nocardia carnea]